MRRRAFVLGGVALGCAAAAPRSEGGLLRLAAAPLGHDIDPYRDDEFGVDELSWLYADGLVGWDRDIGIVPLLAAELPESADAGRVFRYRLRDAAWHDGRPFVARDVVDALEALRATPLGTREPYASVRDVVMKGAREVEVRLAAPRRSFVRSFFGPYGFPAIPLIRHEDGTTPIGTGPFSVRRRVETERWSLTRWEGSPRGAPRLDALELRLLRLDVTANVQLLSGEADVALPLPSNLLGADRFRRVRRTTSTAVLLMNAEGALGTTLLRRAFAAAADVPALQRAYDRTRTSLLASLFLSGRDDDDLAATLAHRPAAASALRDVTRERELTLVYVGGSPSHERTMTLLQQNLGLAGVRSSLRPCAASVYMDEVGPLRSGRFDACIYGLVYADDAELAADWGCANRPPHGGNFSRWCDPAFESAIERGDHGAAARRLYDELLCLPLSHAYEEIGVAPWVHGLDAPVPLVPATYGCAGWSISAADRR